MWRLTAPVPNATIFKALILHALKTKNIDVTDADKLTIATKIFDFYFDIDKVRNHTIFYCDEFSFTNSKGEKINIKLKTRFMEKGFESSEFDALYGTNASSQALESAGVFKNLSFSIQGAPTPKPMLFAKPASAKPLTEVPTATPAKTKAIDIPPPTVKGTQTPRTPMIAKERRFKPIESYANISSLIPNIGSYSSGSFDDASINLGDDIEMDEYDVDGKPSGRITSTSTVSTNTPGLGLDGEQAEQVESRASSLQFAMT